LEVAEIFRIVGSDLQQEGNKRLKRELDKEHEGRLKDQEQFEKDLKQAIAKMDADAPKGLVQCTASLGA